MKYLAFLLFVFTWKIWRNHVDEEAVAVSNRKYYDKAMQDHWKSEQKTSISSPNESWQQRGYRQFLEAESGDSRSTNLIENNSQIKVSIPVARDNAMQLSETIFEMVFVKLVQFDNYKIICVPYKHDGVSESVKFCIFV